MVKKRNVLLIKSEKTHKGAAAVLAGAFKNHPDLRFISIGEDKLGFKSVNTLRVLCLRALKRSPLLMRGAARLQKVFADRSINDTPSGDKDKKQLPGKEKKLKNAVLRFEPAAIVAMTPFDMRLVLRTRKKAGLKTPVVGILNTFTLDFGFFDMSADAYLALDEAAKEKMVGLGYPEDKVTVAGYPVDAKALSEEEIAEIRAGLSVPKTPCVYLSGGSFAPPALIQVFNMLADQGEIINLVLPASENKKATKSLHRAADAKASGNVKLLSSSEPDSDYFLASDIVCTIYDAELIYKSILLNKPVIVFGPENDVETADLEYLAEKGLIYYAKTLPETVIGLYNILQSDFKERQKDAAESFIKPSAEGALVKIISALAASAKKDED